MSLSQDVRFGSRALRKSPGFTLTAIITMALGIGATTATFSVADAMLWKPIPLPRLDTLVTVIGRVPGEPKDYTALTPADADDIRAQAASFDRLATYNEQLANLAGAGNEPERVNQALVSADFFEVIGVQPAHGGGFQPEDQLGREREVVLSDALWQRRFGADPKIVGKSIRIDDRDYTVTGVVPPRVEFPKATDIWTPLALTPEARHSRQVHSVLQVARLKPGENITRAEAELEGIGRRLEQLYPDTNKGRRFRAMSLHEFMIGEYSHQYVLMLMDAVIFVLLIACVNVANLQFARATGRLSEVAVRTALGARRLRLVSQLVTESVLLCVAGAVLGLVFANWGLNLIRSGMPAEIERYVVGWKEIHLDSRSLTFTIAAAVLSGVLAGLIPAWQSTRPNLTESLKEGGRGSSAGRARHRLRSMLVAAEIALSVVLLVGASLMVRGFSNLMHRTNNMDPASFLTMRLAITENKYPEDHQVQAFYRQVLERISAVPGVRSAAIGSAMPYTFHNNGSIFTIENRRPEPGNQPSAMFQAVSASFFPALNIPLRAGRLLDERDGANTPRVAVISQRLAERFFPGERLPLGKRIKLSDIESNAPWITIVGVVGDISHSIWDRMPRATLYVPYTQAPQRFSDVGVRTAGDPLRLAPAITAAIRSVDAEEPVTQMQTMVTGMRHDATGLDYVAVMMAIFGALALALSAIGVYGVMAYLVSEQTHEIGIRMALGASRRSVLGAVFRRGMITTALGLSFGLVVAYGFAQLLASLIFGVSAQDFVTFTAIPLALIASATLAIYIPARRAMRIDPIVALRYE